MMYISLTTICLGLGRFLHNTFLKKKKITPNFKTTNTIKKNDINPKKSLLLLLLRFEFFTNHLFFTKAKS